MPGHDADGRHREVARREPEVVVQPLERRAHRVDVGERLAHAHEHDVRDPLRAWRAARARPARRSRRASRWRSKPAWPVAQNVQPIAQPACDETHTVARSALSISTVSTCAPSCVRHSHLLVAPSAARLLGDRRERERERVGELARAAPSGASVSVVERRALRPQAVVELRDAVLAARPTLRGAPRARSRVAP